MVLFKYFDSVRGLQLLQTLRLYFTPPKYFNDINEMSPFVVKTFSHADYIRYFQKNDYLKPIYDSWVRRGFKWIPYDEFLKLAPSHPLIYQEVESRVESACKGLQQEFKKVMSEHTGICCFSELPTSNLMWAHYAERHQGICVAMELEASSIQLVDIVKVDYRNEKVRIPPWFLELTEQERNVYYLQIASSKGTEWAYEVERRLIANLEVCSTDASSGGMYYFQTIDPKDIKKIVLGVESRLKSEVEKVVQKDGRNWEVASCRQEPESFLLKMTT